MNRNPTDNSGAIERRQIEAMVARAEETPDKTQSTIIQGWSFVLSFGALLGQWQLSARLHPPGRSSESCDWKALGWLVARFTEATGLPQGEEPKLLTPFETTPPTSTHYWIWRPTP